MSRTCGDCNYCRVNLHSEGYRCVKKNKKVDIEDYSCSNYVNQDAKTCLECYYLTYKQSIFGNKDIPYCERTNKKILAEDKACSYFIED